MNRIKRRAAVCFGGVSLALGVGATNALASGEGHVGDSPAILAQVAAGDYVVLDSAAMDQIVGAFVPVAVMLARGARGQEVSLAAGDVKTVYTADGDPFSVEIAAEDVTPTVDLTDSDGGSITYEGGELTFRGFNDTVITLSDPPSDSSTEAKVGETGSGNVVTLVGKNDANGEKVAIATLDPARLAAEEDPARLAAAEDPARSEARATQTGATAFFPRGTARLVVSTVQAQEAPTDQVARSGVAVPPIARIISSRLVAGIR
jgi:hypothetical protein